MVVVLVAEEGPAATCVDNRMATEPTVVVGSIDVSMLWCGRMSLHVLKPHTCVMLLESSLPSKDVHPQAFITRSPTGADHQGWTGDDHPQAFITRSPTCVTLMAMFSDGRRLLLMYINVWVTSISSTPYRASPALNESSHGEKEEMNQK